MNKEEMICKNCKYHYIEEISFDYPQSCCDKRKAVIEEWFNCNDFEYSDRYIKQLQQENKQLKVQLLVAQTNEETFRLEMEDITKILGLDENTLFDDVKAYVRSLKNNWNKLKECLKDVMNSSNDDDKDFVKTILDIIQEIEQGSDNNE